MKKRRLSILLIIGIILVVVFLAWSHKEQQNLTENEYFEESQNREEDENNNTDEFQKVPEEEYHNGSKAIIIFDRANSGEEEVVLYNFIYTIQSDYASLLNTYAVPEDFQIEVNNTEKLEREGYYIQRYEINDLESVQIESSDDYYIQEEIEKSKYEKYSLVVVDFYMEWSEIALEQAMQYGNGTYQREFLCGLKDGEWKICEIGMM